MAIISRLGVVLGLDTGEFVSGLGMANTKLDKFASSVKTGLAVAATAAAAALVASVKHAADFADEIGKAAIKVGVTTEQLSALKFAADLSDVSFETLQGGMKRLSIKMLDVAEGNKEAIETFKSLGLSVFDANGKLKNVADFMPELADKFQQMESGATRTALAVKVFSKAGAELLPLLVEGSSGLKKSADEAARFGKIISTDAAVQAQEFNDNLTRISAASEGLSIKIGNMLIPTIVRFTDELLKFAETNNLFIAAMMATGSAIDRVLFGNKDEQAQKLRDGIVKNIGKIKSDIDEMTNKANPEYRRFFTDEARATEVFRLKLNLARQKYSLDKANISLIKPTAKPVQQQEAETIVVVNAELQKQKDALLENINAIKMQQQELDGVASVAEKLTLEFKEHGKYSELANTPMQAKAMAEARTLDNLTKEKEINQIIFDLRSKEAFALGAIYKQAEDINESNVEKIQNERDAFDLETKSIEIVAKRLEYEHQLVGLSDTQTAKALEYFDLQQKIIRIAEEEIGITTSQIEARTSAEQARIDAQEATTRGQNTFQSGWDKAFSNYKERAMDSASVASDAFNNMAQGMERALDSFVRTGKLNFADLTRSIIADLITMQIKAQATSIFGGLFGGIGGGGGNFLTSSSTNFNNGAGLFGGFFADGGEPPVGIPSIVGERGPELFIPKNAGTIIPNHSLDKTMKSQPQVVYNGTVIQNMSAIDTQTGIQFLSKNKNAVWAANQSAQRSLPMSR